MAVHATLAAQRVYDVRWAGDVAQERQANIEAELESVQGQVATSNLVLCVSTQLLNVLSASVTASSRALDRHWRNVRMVALHSPLIHKACITGGWYINGIEPPYMQQIGAGLGAMVTQPIAKATRG